MGSHAKELKKYIHEQLGTTDEILYHWATNPYPIDGKTVSDFWNKIKNAPAIEIIGDYDVDGICASHIMSTSIRHVFPGKKVKVRIPRRFSEGYGINDIIANEIIETMPKESVVITVDNGIAAAPVLERLQAEGFHVLMTDHHELREGSQIPKADMVIDPSVKEIDNPFTGRYWCGAAVAFKLCEPMISDNLAEELTCFAGLATVSDCMELREGNWGLVRKALSIFRKGKGPESLRMLLSAMGQNPDFVKEDDFGFYLGPAFNAPGRLIDNGAVMVLKYLYQPSPEQCAEIVEWNNQRKEIRDEEVEKVIHYLEETGHTNDFPIWATLPGLHEGIVGIIAGKISEKYKRPAIVLTTMENDENMIKGSARSYGSFNIFQYLSGMSDLFTKMGGHAGAAGLSMPLENFEKARANQITSEEIEEDLNASIIKMAIDKWEIPYLAPVLDKFRPFGQGNAAPEFEVEVDDSVDKIKMIGNPQIHLSIAGPKLNPKDPKDYRVKYKVMHFNHEPNDLLNPNHFMMRGTISESTFNGNTTPQFLANEIYDIGEER